MKFVIQRVKKASVSVSSKSGGAMGPGMLVFISIEKEDKEGDLDYFVRKISELRMFEDEHGKMNLSARDAHAEFLVVSQFTLSGSCEKGRRPSFDKAAEPGVAQELYNLFVEKLRALHFKVETGEFRAMMDVSLINDGPVTFIL